jgi:hypothetical protein
MFRLKQQFGMVAGPRFEPTAANSQQQDGAIRRMQVRLLCDRRNYDRSVAGLGAGKAQRYFASDFDRLSDRLLDASGIEVIEVVMSRAPQRGTACVPPVQQ